MLKSTILDELTNDELLKCINYLEKHTIKSNIENLYWLHIPDEFLNKNQINSIKYDGKYKIAIELGKSWIKIEYLIRNNNLYNNKNTKITFKIEKFISNFYKKMINFINK
jgi:hypothetical protein